MLAAVGASCLAGAASGATPAVRSDQDSGGARLLLSGRQLVVELPKATPINSRVRAGCGRSGRSGRRVAFARGTFSGDRLLRFRLARDVSRVAEWCTFETRKRNVDARRLPYGAVALGPQPPENLRSGPGVREAVTTSVDGQAYGGFAGEDGDAHFLLDGRVLTVRLRERSVRSELVRLVCVQGSTPESERSLGSRTVVLQKGKRAVTADLEGSAEEKAAGCLIEGTGEHSGDIAVAAFE